MPVDTLNPDRLHNAAVCDACGADNQHDMAFCLACGHVLSTRLAAERHVSGVARRQCKTCHRADELNYRFCIFCGAAIDLVIGRTTRPEALEKFTQELTTYSQTGNMQINPALYPSLNFDPARQSQVRMPAMGNAGETLYAAGQGGTSTQAHDPTASAFIWLSLIGLILGGVMAYLFSSYLTPLYFSFLSPNTDLLIFTDKKYVNVSIENKDRTQMILGQTSKAGSLGLNDVAVGKNYLNFSQNNSRGLNQVCQIEKGRLNLIGFGGNNGKVTLPAVQK